MLADEKKCPMCAETIKRAALVCKHCGHKFQPAEVAAAKQPSNAEAVAGCIAILVVLIFLVSMCSGGGSSSSNSTATAEDRRKGFHCLSAWDGSSSQFVEAVKAALRDPNSFEHVETRISPVRDGQHMIMMTYRARNGFGGMNVQTAMGTVSQATCAATLITAG